MKAPSCTLRTSQNKIISCLRSPSSWSAALAQTLMRCCNRYWTRFDRAWSSFAVSTTKVELKSKSSTGKAARARSNSVECVGSREPTRRQNDRAQDATAAHGREQQGCAETKRNPNPGRPPLLGVAPPPVATTEESARTSTSDIDRTERAARVERPIGDFASFKSAALTVSVMDRAIFASGGHFGHTIVAKMITDTDRK